MRIATIDGVAVSRPDHAAAEASRSSKMFSGTFPARISLKRHSWGTPRCRHFLSADGVAPISRAASTTRCQAGVSSGGVIMGVSVRDDLSPSQGTKWGNTRAFLDGTFAAMKRESPELKAARKAFRGETRKARRIATAVRTKELRERLKPDVSMEEMADRLLVSLDAYKKYESRSAMPSDIAEDFCEIVGCSIDYLYAGREAAIPGRRRRG